MTDTVVLFAIMITSKVLILTGLLVILRQRRKLPSIYLLRKISNNLFKSTVNHLDSVDGSKIAKDSEFGVGNKYSRCNSCDKEREIVFEREGFRLCNDCLDEFMREHRFKK